MLSHLMTPLFFFFFFFLKYLSVKMGVMLSLNDDAHFHQLMTTSWYVPNICLEEGIYVVAK